MRVLLATDASWLVDDLVAALGDEDTSFTVCSEGREVSRQIARAADSGDLYDVGIFDLQIGSMGGMAVTMALRLDASVGRAPSMPVVMLLDRVADVHLARRSDAEGWLVKPLDPLRIRRAVRTVVAGGTYREGLPPEPIADESPVAADAEGVDEPTGSEVVTAG